MNVNDKYTVGLGLIQNAKYVPDSSKGSSNLVVDLINQSVQGDNSFGTPCLYPFGFSSLPPDNTYALTINITGITSNPICLGTIPSSVNLFSKSGLMKGESATYSLNYGIQAKLSALLAKFKNGSGEHTATMLYGENVVKVLIDIITQMESLYSTQLANIISQLNSHRHIVPNVQIGTSNQVAYTMSMSGTTISTPTIDQGLPQDLSDLQAGKAYVNDQGEPM